jgi:Tfp pilus assembly protein PilF
VSEEKQRAIRHRRDDLRRKIRQDVAQQLPLAAYYLQQQLYSEALALLDTLVQQIGSAPVHLIRAHVLLEMQLVETASKQYEQARHLAAQQQDRESQAEALVGLARASGDPATMVQYYQEAMRLYQALGERERAEKLGEELQSAR